MVAFIESLIEALHKKWKTTNGRDCIKSEKPPHGSVGISSDPFYQSLLQQCDARSAPEVTEYLCRKKLNHPLPRRWTVWGILTFETVSTVLVFDFLYKSA